MLNDDDPSSPRPRSATSAASPLPCPPSRPAVSSIASVSFVLNGYGQAEIGEVIGWTAADAKAHPEKIGAVGRPIRRRHQGPGRGRPSGTGR